MKANRLEINVWIEDEGKTTMWTQYVSIVDLLEMDRAVFDYLQDVIKIAKAKTAKEKEG